MAASTNRQSAINSITLLGSLVNFMLVIIKAGFGWLTGSMALLADGIHSLSDLVTDAIVLIGTALARKPADDKHPFGHGKFETMATFTIAALLIATGLVFVYRAIVQFGEPLRSSYPHWTVMSVALFSVVVKEWLFFKSIKTAKAFHSATLLANAWHHRSDSLSSLAVLLGALAVQLGWTTGDAAAGAIVGLMISYAGLKILFNAVDELGEAAVDEHTVQSIKQILDQIPEIHSFHRLRTRQSGFMVLMDFHILVDPTLSLIASHDISKKVEAALQQGLERPVNMTVHVEPDLPSER